MLTSSVFGGKNLLLREDSLKLYSTPCRSVLWGIKQEKAHRRSHCDFCVAGEVLLVPKRLTTYLKSPVSLLRYLRIPLFFFTWNSSGLTVFPLCFVRKAHSKCTCLFQAADERNYHVFYEMLKGLDASRKSRFGLETAEKYFYLNQVCVRWCPFFLWFTSLWCQLQNERKLVSDAQGGSCRIQSKDDLKDFADLQASMEVLGFTGAEQDTIYKILASVLHLGNVYFKKVQVRWSQIASGIWFRNLPVQQHNVNCVVEPILQPHWKPQKGKVSWQFKILTQNEHQHEGVEMGSESELKWVSQLLQLSEDWLKQALTMKVTVRLQFLTCCKTSAHFSWQGCTMCATDSCKNNTIKCR